MTGSVGLAGLVGHPGVLAATTIAAPHIEYSQLAPMLVVFGAALAGVLVEAFAPRSGPPWPAPRAGARRPRCGVHPDHPDRRVRQHLRRRRRRARRGHGRGGRGPAHPVHPGHDPGARPGQRADHRGHRTRPEPVRRAGRRGARQRRGTRRTAEGRHAHRDLPAHPVRHRRHAAVPRRQRPAHDVRGPGGAVAPAVPALRARPAAPPAVAGSGGEVLPARRVLLGDLPVRHRDALRVRGLGAAVRHRRGGLHQHRQRDAAADRDGTARRGPAVQDRGGAVPGAGSPTCTRARPRRSPP